MYGRRPCLRLELKSSRTLDDSGSGESHSGGAVVPEGAWHSSRDTRKIKMGEAAVILAVVIFFSHVSG